MDAMASQITSFTIVYSTVYSGADQRKHQSPASLAFVWGIHRWPTNSPHKWPVMRKMFPFYDVIMYPQCALQGRRRRPFVEAAPSFIDVYLSYEPRQHPTYSLQPHRYHRSLYRRCLPVPHTRWCISGSGRWDNPIPTPDPHYYRRPCFTQRHLVRFECWRSAFIWSAIRRALWCSRV